MLSSTAQAKLCELFLVLSEEEREIEVIRQVLCEQVEFEPYAAFIRIDRLKQGFLTAFDIQQFLLSNNIHYTEAECFYFIQQYDKDLDNSLVFAEFLYSILPQDNPDLRTLASQRPNYDVRENEFLTNDIEYTLSKLLSREIELGREIHARVKSLQFDAGFSLRAAFDTIDFERIGILDYENIRAFFRSCNILPFEEEVICVLRRLDIDDDGRIAYQELVDRLQPREVVFSSTQRVQTTVVSKVQPATTVVTKVQPATHVTEVRERVNVSPVRHTTVRYTSTLASPTRQVVRRVSPVREERVVTEVAERRRVVDSPTQVVTQVSERRRVVDSPSRVVTEVSERRRVADSPSRVVTEVSERRRVVDSPTKVTQTTAVRTSPSRTVVRTYSPSRRIQTRFSPSRR